MFDLTALTRAIRAHGSVARVVVAEVRGSAPREVGASMLVWVDGQSGTIGGGALEYDAADRARRGGDGPLFTRHALGPDLGQCCGGSVSLLTEWYDADSIPFVQNGVIARPALYKTNETPFPVRRVLARARSRQEMPQPALIDGWMIEPAAEARRSLWIWGAGHVGRALVSVLSPLPDFAITWVDTGADRFPSDVPEGVTTVPAADPALLAAHAPTDAHHLVLTYSHAIDLALCDTLLRRGFNSLGLIGSATKWARFRSRLAALGHGPDAISRITCPIGDPSLGKHPQAIAVGVSAQILRRATARADTNPGREHRQA
ncbi:xanthine dehydrogenase accessory protein XdhC [Chachezhania sediminis]|uniref:xanthine dehydrogenase accessory protein XdhC n=1 Tax=Chachezhania sediminis TaxID=2599291 RepID=UPI00131E05AF|nr:xanthine dehydrogenase accessory protein XdhC [Chachezhania sediminis]